MIKMTRCESISKIDKSLELVPNAVGYIAADENGSLGHSAYIEDKDMIRLLKLDVKNDDFAIADGLARASLFASLDIRKYAMLISDGGGLIDRFAKAIGAETGKPIEIEKIFSGCASCAQKE